MHSSSSRVVRALQLFKKRALLRVYISYIDILSNYKMYNMYIIYYGPVRLSFLFGLSMHTTVLSEKYCRVYTCGTLDPSGAKY